MLVSAGTLEQVSKALMEFRAHASVDEWTLKTVRLCRKPGWDTGELGLEAQILTR